MISLKVLRELQILVLYRFKIGVEFPVYLFNVNTVDFDLPGYFGLPFGFEVVAKLSLEGTNPIAFANNDDIPIFHWSLLRW